MSPTAALDPAVRYDASYEHLEQDEGGIQKQLDESLLKISKTTLDDGGRPLRSVHAKSHGLLRARVQVLEGLPPELTQGICAQVRAYDAIIRLSTAPGDLLPDSVSTPRGFAIKLVDVPGPRLPGAEGASTQDFVTVNGGPVFATPTAKRFATSLKMLASTTDKAEGAKKVLSAALRGMERVLEAVGGSSATLVTLGGQPTNHLLGETFFSQVPILWGPFMAKISVVPVISSLTNLTGKPLDLTDKPNAIRDSVVDYFSANRAEWELRVQLNRNIDTMPLEDATVEWPEDVSAYLPVARVIAEKQVAWSEVRSAAVDAGMAFSPWHGIAAHRPLGSIMRLRKLAYETSAKFRASQGTLVREPATLDGFPD